MGIQPRGSAFTVQRWMKILVGVFALLLVMVWEHVQATHLERELLPMRREADRLTYENARLQMQINQWVSPSHLESLAKKDYHMGPLDPSHRLGLEKHD